jgi:AAA domain/Bifunctional DNA primase/polymerase, N-terminal
MLDQDDDFVSICTFARNYYHAHKWQIVPLSHNSKIPPSKFPVKELHKHLLDEDVFESLWGEAGKFVTNYNCGLITGEASGNICIVDLDTKKANGWRAAAWWEEMEAIHGRPFDTPTQVTGSGGVQIFFKMPKGVRAFQSANEFLCVDFRGQGGYTVLPPSKHPDGGVYKWVDGQSPDETDLMEMPKFLIDEISSIVGPAKKVGDPSARKSKYEDNKDCYNVWGERTNNREPWARSWAFSVVVKMHRETGGELPNEKEIEKRFNAFWLEYLNAVGAKDETINEHLGSSKEKLITIEGRGKNFLLGKFNTALAKWDGLISQTASQPYEEHERPFDADEYQTTEDIKIDVEDQSIDDEFGPSQPNIYKLYTMDDMEAMPPAQALVEDVIAENSLGFIFGAPGCGKTFIAMSLGLSIAYGFQSWFWGKKIEKSGPVIYICAEGFNVMWNRMKAWKLEHGIINNDKNFLMLPDTVNLTKRENVQKLMATLKYMVESHPSKQPPIAVFVDTVSRSIAGANENDAQDMSVFVEVCETIKRLFQTNIVGVHHTGRAGTNMRGSTALDGAADYLLFIKRDKTDGNLNGTIEATKIKAFEDGWVKDFELKKKAVTIDGKTSLVAIGADKREAVNHEEAFGGKQETAIEPDMNLCLKMVAAIDEAFRGSYAWSRDKKSRDTNRYAPDKLSDMFGLSVETCEKYVNMWHKKDVIVTDIWGEKSNKRGLRRGKGL